MAKIAAVVCSTGRPEVLHQTLESIRMQSHPVEQILAVVASPGDVSSETGRLHGVEVIVAARGSCAQRNAGLEAVRADVDLVAFFDDDVELSPAYLSEMVELFESIPNAIGSTGLLLRDGGVEREKARELISGHARCEGEYEIRRSLYGNNMVVRRAAVGHVRFDERLPLYGWLEDTDYSAQCARYGDVYFNPRAVAVHLKAQAGRVSGLRFGFSQIMNPTYLWTKGSIPSFANLVVSYWVAGVGGNLRGLLVRDSRVDRPARLKGNFLAFWRMARSGVLPEFVSRLE